MSSLEIGPHHSGSVVVSGGPAWVKIGFRYLGGLLRNTCQKGVRIELLTQHTPLHTAEEAAMAPLHLLSLTEEAIWPVEIAIYNLCSAHFLSPPDSL